jgi:hypothetical protein
MTFVGFDLHKRYNTACALDATGEIFAEIRQLSTAIEAVHAWLGALPGHGPAHPVIETERDA